MCNHKRTELKDINYKTGRGLKLCLECGENLGEIPATYSAVMDYCTSKKINTHFANPSPTNNMVVLDNLKFDKSY